MKHSKQKQVLTLRRLSLLVLTLISAIVLLYGPPNEAYGQTGITVDTTVDEKAVNGTCSLREAIQNANDTANTYPECGYAGAPVTINFAAGLSGQTITLGSRFIITGSVTIDGSSLPSQIIIDGGGTVKHFEVWASTVLNNLTLTNGSALYGASVQNANTLTINNSTIKNSLIPAGAGGAVYNQGAGTTLTINNSTIVNNDDPAAAAGGVYNHSGTVNINNSTIANNDAFDGGGVRNEGGIMNIKNSTISNNSASNSGSGILNNTLATLHIQNSIIANNTGSSHCTNNGTIATNSNNLIEDGSCSPAITADPALGPLQNNGGSTDTMAIAPGSPAIDAGDNATCLGTDQTGTTRPQNGTCDIGAYEFLSVPSVINVNTTTDELTVNGTCSLREAIQNANDGANSYPECGWTGTPVTINLPAGTYALTINGTHEDANVNGDLDIHNPVTIKGAGARTTIVDQQSTDPDRVFDIDSTVTIEDITIKGGEENRNSSGLSSGNRADGGGAGILLYNSNLTLRRVIVRDNIAQEASNTDGGGIYNYQGILYIYDSTFVNNKAVNSTVSNTCTGCDGGAIAQNSGTLYIQNSTFYGNESSFGIVISFGTANSITIINSTFSDNSISSAGSGTVSLNATTVNFINNIVANQTGTGIAPLCTITGGGTTQNNLITDSSCTATITGAPGLGALANNGGDTDTMAITASSPAYNAGSGTPFCPATDQAGNSRPLNGTCDIGAFEYLYVPPPPPRSNATHSAHDDQHRRPEHECQYLSAGLSAGERSG